MNIHIIGCGSIGARLATKVYEYLPLTELCLYDGDLVTKEDLPVFPKDTIGIYKVHALQKHLLYLSDLCKPIIFNHYDYVIQDIDLLSEDFIIDCRDKKFKKINSHIRISFDKNILFIDASPDFNLYSDVQYEYENEKNILYFDLATNIIVNFIDRKYYLNQKFHFYNLDEIIKGKELNTNGSTIRN